MKAFHPGRIQAVNAFPDEPLPDPAALEDGISHHEGQQRQALVRVIQDDDHSRNERGLQLGRQARLPDNRPPPARQSSRSVRIGITGPAVLIIHTAAERQPHKPAERSLISRTQRSDPPLPRQRRGRRLHRDPCFPHMHCVPGHPAQATQPRMYHARHRNDLLLEY
jgi:hypothetical protein